MKTIDFLEDYLKEDFISKIYHNDLEFAEYEPTTSQYIKIKRQVREKERELNNIKMFKQYLELRNIKESIEVEEQFKLGFKTAVKIIIESYH